MELMSVSLGRGVRGGLIAAAIVLSVPTAQAVPGAISGTIAGFESAFPAAVACSLPQGGPSGCQLAVFSGFLRARDGSGYWTARVVHAGLPTTRGGYAAIEGGSFKLRTRSGRTLTGSFAANRSGLEYLGRGRGSLCTQTFAVSDWIYPPGTDGSHPIGTFSARLTHYGTQAAGGQCRIFFAVVSGRLTVVPG